MGLMAVLLSTSAACGSNETVSGASDAVVVTDTVDTVPTTVSTVVVESVPDTTLPEPTSPETTTNLAALDERLTPTPIGVTPQCSETSCVSVAVTLAGEVVSYDSSTRVLTFVDSGRTVVIDPSVVGLWYLVLMGPDEVAYLTSFPDGVRGEALDLVTDCS